MITTINEFKKHIYEFNSNYEHDMDMFNPYSNEELIRKLNKEIQTLSDLDINLDTAKLYFNKLILLFDKIPSKLLVNALNVFILTFSMYITLPQIKELVDNSTNKKILSLVDSTELKNIVDKSYKHIPHNKTKIMDKYITPTEFSDTLIEFLKHEEGSIKKKGQPVLIAYDIKDGKITVGYGHAEDKKTTKMIAGVTKITLQQAEDLLIQDIMEAQRGVDKILRDWKKEGIDIKINQNQYDALISMTYNMGIGNMRKSQFIQLVKQNKFDEAAKKIKTTNVTYPGHVKRRNMESFLFSNQNDVTLDNIINQA